MANDIEFMYASVKALVCIVKSNLDIAKEMDRLNGYQLLAMLYKRKKHLINSHILNLTFSLLNKDKIVYRYIFIYATHALLIAFDILAHSFKWYMRVY